jgi:hypothetical protein
MALPEARTNHRYIWSLAVGLVVSALVIGDLHHDYQDRIEAAGSKTKSLTLVLAEHERQTVLRLERPPGSK